MSKSTISSSSGPQQSGPAHAQPSKNLHVPAWAAYGVEAASAITSSLLVAPIISIIDKAIFSNASGKEKMGASIINSAKSLISSPAQFARSPSFLWIWFVYGGTYVTANLVERAYERRGKDWFLPKFIGSSISNVGLSVVKDRAFSRMYGVTAPKPVPALSFALFAARDSMTIGASFNLPIIIARDLEGRGYSKTWSYVIAQLIAPVSMQIFNTPLHLLGMDRYNNPDSSSAQRLSFIRREYTKTLLARWGRIFPAFGLGGLTNKSLRRNANAALADHFKQ